MMQIFNDDMHIEGTHETNKKHCYDIIKALVRWNHFIDKKNDLPDAVITGQFW